MKSLFCSVVMLGLSLSLLGQSTIPADQIMSDIKAGKSINYDNATITGILDFTYMDEKLSTLPKRSKNWNGSNSIDETIRVSISFKNCTFSDDVIAYFHDEDSGYTFNADFRENVTFTNCNFKEKAMFKYSDFDERADFSGSTFRDDTTFKYAKFEKEASFSGTTFHKNAVFKYSEFDKGVSFAKSVFKRSLDFKYLKVRGDFDATDMSVDDDINTKYTSINGKSFSKQILND
jgi:hypothetical protein